MPPIEDNKNDYTAISLFSGCGGSSAGYKMAGFDIRLAIEWDDMAVKAYRKSFPNTPIYHGDIKNLTEKELLKLSGIAKKELTLLDGSPPCQGFSSAAGIRTSEDPRNYLFLEYLRILKILSPKSLIMENVAALARGRMKKIYWKIMNELKEANYNVQGWVINTAWYEIPQERERTIIIGFRKDLNISPSIPSRISIIPKSASEALGNKFITLRNEQFNNKWRFPDKPSPTICASDNIKISNCILLPNNKMRIIGKERRLTIEELRILQGFPDWLYALNRKQIGNSVPPPLTKILGEQIKLSLERNK